MKVILTKNVHNLGRAGDILEVKDGYARNYLVPEGNALEADSADGKEWLNKKTKQQKVLEQNKNQRDAVADKLRGAVLRYVRPAAKNGHLYAAITSADIAVAARLDLKITLDESQLEIPQPIKSAGTHNAVYRGNQGKVNFRILVIAQNENST